MDGGEGRRGRGGRVAALVAGVALALAALAPAAGAAPTWTAYTTLFGPPDATDVTVVAERAAMGPDGDAAAVWMTGRDVGFFPLYTVQAAARAPGGAWVVVPEPLSIGDDDCRATFCDPVEFAPEIGVDGAGTAIAVWSHHSAFAGRVQVAVHPRDGAWSAPQPLSAEDVDARRPALAVRPDGTAIVTWIRMDDRTIEASVRAPNGTWGGPEPVMSVGSAEFQDVAALPGGGAVVVWGGVGRVRSSVRDQAGTWSAFEDLNTPGNNLSVEPVVATNGAGDAVAAWLRFDGQSAIVQSSRRPAGGPWTETQGDAKPVSEPAGSSAAFFNLDLRLTPGGEAVAAWCRHDGAQYIAQANVRPPGGEWPADPQDLSAVGGDAFGTRLAVNPSGAALVAWSRAADGDTSRVQAAVRPAGGRFTSTGPDVVGDPEVGAFGPDVGLDADGNGVAVAMRAGFLVQAIGYDAAGPRLTSLAVPSSGTAGVPLALSARWLDVWSPLAGATTWAFGDGTGAQGDDVGHAWGAPGVFSVGVGRTDAVGNRSVAGGFVTIAPGPAAPGTPSPPPPAAAASGARSGPGSGSGPAGGTRARDRRAPRAQRLLVRRTAGRLSVTFRLSEPATLDVRLERARSARARFALVRRQRLRRPAGTVRLSLPAAAPGRYRLRMSLTDAAGNRSTASRTLTVRRVLPRP